MSHISDPALRADAVTKSDATVFTSPTRALYIGTTGDVAVRMYGGQNVITFKTVPVGILPIAVDKVMSTGTTAAEIIALY